MEHFTTALWFGYFEEPIDDIPDYPDHALQKIRKYFFTCTWYQVYEFIEFILNNFKYENLAETINSALESKLSAYRYIGNIFTTITNEQEIQMLEDAFMDEDFPGVSSHLKRALELLEDRDTPDYRNSIKESVSALESLAKSIANDPNASLGKALKIIEKSHKIHPALISAFTTFYGYTSDEEGIRHGMMDEPNLSASDAKFFLLSFTSFINYLKSKI